MGTVSLRRCWDCDNLTAAWGPCVHCSSGPTKPMPPATAPAAYLVHPRPPMDGEQPRLFSAQEEDKVRSYEQMGCAVERVTDVAVLRDLIDRRPDLNACALRPGQAVHVHALERILADLQPGGPEYFARMEYHHDRDTLLAQFAALETFEEMCAYDEGEEVPIKPGEVDGLILRARELIGYTLAPPQSAGE